MMSARLETFGDIWPLDTAAGYPGVDQLAAAGWYYDPTEGTPDGVSCAYCHLALDAWDEGDDPFEEHRRRAPDCLFFTLNDLYHPKVPEPKKAKRANKRTSTRSSVASTSSTTKKATRTKKCASEAVDDTHLSESSQYTKKTTRGRKQTNEDMDNTQLSTVVPETSKKTGRGKKRTTEDMDNTQLSTFNSSTTKKTVRSKKRTSEAMADIQVSDYTSTKATKSKKRTSEAMEGTQQLEPSYETSKRMRYSSISSLPDDLPVGTPKKMPTELDTEPFTMSSLPPSLLVGTPKRTPLHLKETDDPSGGIAWQPTDMDTFFVKEHDTKPAFVNDIVIDGGLDDLTMAGTISEDIKAAVLAGLTETEKEMSIEQWVLYNAKRGEEKLRNACEQQILAFEAEGRRALTAMDAIATY
jgi:hypothetical protein